MKTVKFKENKSASLPRFATEGSAGADLRAATILGIYSGDGKKAEDFHLKILNNYFQYWKELEIPPYHRVLIGTQLFVASMPNDIELQVRSRSGMTLKRGLVVLNSPGTIDSDYRGEIGVILYNTNPTTITLEKGERIAQLVPKKVEKVSFDFTTEFEETERSDKGFGSTG